MAAQRISQLSRQLFHRVENHYVQQGIHWRQMSISTFDTEKAREVLKTRQTINILDSHISYLDTKKGDRTVLFLHGNPTSSYLWRNIIPHVQPVARCLAPDLIGMGQSGKEPNNNYRFVDHYKYLSAWIDSMNLPEKIHLVIHDWGSALGFHWCNMNRNRVASITYMEALVTPIKDWSQFPEQSRDFFQALRSPKGNKYLINYSV